MARNLEQVRDRVKGLYDALDLGYCCECDHSHLANLRLEFWRGFAGELAYESDGGDLHFKFLFCYAPTDGIASLSGCHDAELKPCTGRRTRKHISQDQLDGFANISKFGAAAA